jgi:hypothetical protein
VLVARIGIILLFKVIKPILIMLLLACDVCTRVLVSKLPTLLDAVAVSLMMMKVMSVVSQSWTVQSTFCVTHVHSAKRAVNFAADFRTLPSVALHTCPRHLLWNSTWFYPWCSSRSFSSCTIDLLSTGIVPKDTSSNKSATTRVI